MKRTNLVATRKTPVWVPATGSPKTRIKKATHYLKRKAWVPTTPAERDRALMVVVCNLRRFHRLSAATTLTLIREHYNPRCLASSGCPHAWTIQDILRKYRQVGKRGMYPTLGVADPKAKALARKLELHRQIREFWKKFMIPGSGTSTPAQVREAFVRYRGGEDITPNMLSRAIKIVVGIEPVRPFGKKFYRGFQVLETQLGLIKISGHQKLVA